MREYEIGMLIVDHAVHLHQDLGPGLLETGMKLGDLLNFGEALLKDGIDGIARIVCGEL